MKPLQPDLRDWRSLPYDWEPRRSRHEIPWHTHAIGIASVLLLILAALCGLLD